MTFISSCETATRVMWSAYSKSDTRVLQLNPQLPMIFAPGGYNNITPVPWLMCSSKAMWMTASKYMLSNVDFRTHPCLTPDGTSKLLRYLPVCPYTCTRIVMKWADRHPFLWKTIPTVEDLILTISSLVLSSSGKYVSRKSGGCADQLFGFHVMMDKARKYCSHCTCALSTLRRCMTLWDRAALWGSADNLAWDTE